MSLRRNLSPKKVGGWLEERSKAIWSNLLTDHLWQRILKNTIATTIAVIIALIPAIVAVYGRAAYLGPITTVFGHPGRRFGMMAEALVLAISGTLLGIGWSMFGVYLSSLVFDSNTPAAYTIKGLFLVVALLVHGFLRSHTPRLFTMVLLLIIVSVVSLTSTANTVSVTSVTTLLYPILTASGILLLVNTLIFPEFSSRFLGETTIETLGVTVEALRDAGRYFITIANDSKEERKEENTKASDELTQLAATEGIREDSKASQISTLQRALHVFKKKKTKTPEENGSSESLKTVKFKSLTDEKANLRAKLASCKAAQQECNFELAWAVLPPRDLKPISDTQMKKLVANTIALIGACESKYALIGDEDDKNEDETKDEHQLKTLSGVEDIVDESSRPTTENDTSDGSTDGEEEKPKTEKKRSKSKTRFEKELKDLELVKPRKEIESGDVELLKYLVGKISQPLIDLQEKIDCSVDVVTSCLAYCYDVPKLPSGALKPSGIKLEEIDVWVDNLTLAMSAFDRDSALALESAAALHDLGHPQIDIMPRMETFLISSFLLNLRQAALHTLEMLNQSRVLVEKRQARHGRHRLYAPRIQWRKWLVSGGEADSLALPESGRKDVRTGKREKDVDDDDDSASKKSLLKKKDIEIGHLQQPQALASRPTATGTTDINDKRPELVKRSLVHRLRNGLADFIEYLVGSDDVLYAVKLTVAVFLVTWPAFLSKWNTWYSLNRGLWAALQLVLITEVAIGTSVMTFTLRGIGTTLGCVWGYAAYEARNGNRIVCVVILVIGIIPSAYIQLGSKYVKAGMVSIISMCIVALATEDHTVPGTSTENFLKRLIAFLIGGVVALIVEVVLFPVKARDRLVESLAGSIRQIIEMEACLAYGIETEGNVEVRSTAVSKRFERAKGKADDALTAAETFLPFCANEPRLKGSFKGLALVYAEILYVLHAVVDRMDNMLHLRQEYGSDVLEDLNEKVYPYRRNVAGSITLVLFAVHEALTTKLPLPQFLPSARLAHLRMVNRVREVVLTGDMHKHKEIERSGIELSMVKRVVRQKFLSWNAASAGQIEVIEYLEELIDLTKLLVGANEFRSGLLTRPTYREYVERSDRGGLDDMWSPTNRDTSKADNQYDGIEEGIMVDDESDELRDVVPEPGIKADTTGARRRRTFSRGEKDGKLRKQSSEEEAFEKQRLANEEELPRSLQRVRSRRLEEIQISKSLSRDDAAKQRREGKRVDIEK